MSLCVTVERRQIYVSVLKFKQKIYSRVLDKHDFASFEDETKSIIFNNFFQNIKKLLCFLLLHFPSFRAGLLVQARLNQT